MRFLSHERNLNPGKTWPFGDESFAIDRYSRVQFAIVFLGGE
jgi:hypothetical protein